LLTCKQFLEELSEYLDETIEPQIREKLERHIAECPNCWVICDTTKKTVQIYKGMESYSLPREVEARLMDALNRKMASKLK